MSLQRVPGHAGLPCYEMADDVARTAAGLNQDGTLVDLQSARARLQRHAHGEWEEPIQFLKFRQTKTALSYGIFIILLNQITIA